MINLFIPTDTELMLEDTLSICKKTDDISTIGMKKIVLKKLKSNITQLLEKRVGLLLRAGYHETDCINLTTVDRLPELQKNYVVIRIHGIIAPIKIAPDTVISDNYDAVLYSINKYGKQQLIEHANSFDVELYRIIKHYKTMRADFIKENPILTRKYKVGDRITITKFNGTYAIDSIDDKHVKITCNKWKREGRKPMTILVQEIKAYAYE